MRKMVRYGCAVVVAVLLFSMPFVFRWRSVVREERYAPPSATAFGYEIETTRGNGGVRVKLFGDNLSILLQANWVELQRIVERRWLCSDRAIHLHLQIAGVDSGDNWSESLRVLFDFERGEMHTYHFGRGWSVPWPDGRSRRDTKPSEFEDALKRLERSCREAGRDPQK
jgi:hypothetical protein